MRVQNLPIVFLKVYYFTVRTKDGWSKCLTEILNISLKFS